MSNYGVEELLLRAEKRTFKAMSPTARCVIMALRFLDKNTEIDELRARIEGYGVPCGQLEAALGVLERAGYVVCEGRRCSLNSYGREVAEALQSVVEGVRMLAYKVMSGGFEEADVLAELVTATASTIGFIEAYVDDVNAGMFYFVLHVYISSLSASVLAELARVNAAVLDIVKRIFENLP